MKRGLLVATILLCVSAALAAEIDSCQNLDTPGTYTLNQSVSSTETCMNITSSDTILDCAGFTITHDTDGDSNSTHPEAGVLVTSSNAVTIANCIITYGNVSGTNKYGIWLTESNTSTISNNTITTNGTSNNEGVLLENLLTANVTNNTITAGGTFASDGLVLTNAVNVSATFNIIGGREGVQLGTNSNTLYLADNSIRTQGGDVLRVDSGTNATVLRNILNVTSGDGDGIDASSDAMKHFIIMHNTIHGTNFGIRSLGINNTLHNNTIHGSGNGQHGLDVRFSGNNITYNTISSTTGYGIHARAHNNRFENNTILSYGSHGVFMESSNNTFARDTIIGNDTSLFFKSGANNSFTDITIFLQSQGITTETWLTSTGNGGEGIQTFTIGTNNTLTDATLHSPDTRVQFLSTITLPDTPTINTTVLALDTNSLFLNSSNVSYLNTSARITFENTSFTGHKILVDLEDDGTFVDCNPPLCTEVSDTATTVTFDVSHFTSFSSQQFIESVPEFSTIALMALLVVTLCGFVVMRRRE